MSTTYEVALLRCEEAAQGTTSFSFQRPAGFDFKAGQFVEMALVLENGDEAFHSFSIASPPSDEALMITTRLRDSAFKQRLAQLKQGESVKIEGPHGSFVIGDQQPAPLVLLAGGIGITPFRSIIHDLAYSLRLEETYLFYANRTPAGSAFLDELTAMHAVPGEFTFIPTMTGLAEGENSWQGERGRVSPDMLMRYVQPQIATYYIAGPPAMVGGTEAMLQEMGIDRGRIRAEKMKGYEI